MLAVVLAFGAAALLYLVVAELLVEATKRRRHHQAGASRLGLVLTAASVLAMPTLGKAKHRLGARLDSATTTGEEAQNMLCAARSWSAWPRTRCSVTGCPAERQPHPDHVAHRAPGPRQ